MYKLLYTGLVILLCFTCQAKQNNEPTIQDLQAAIERSKEDTALVRLLTTLAMKYVIRPGAYDMDMNKAIVHTNRALTLSGKLHYQWGIGTCYLVYSNIFREQNKPEKGERYAQQATIIFTRQGSPADLADAHLETSNYINPYSGDIKAKTKLHEQAAALYQKAGARQQEASTLKTLGDLYQLEERLDDALAATKRALNLYQEVGYTELQAVYDQLGMLAAEMGQYDQAVKYGLLALKTAEQERDSSAMLCTIYNRLGTTHYYVNQLDKAIHYYQAAMSFAVRNKDTMDAMVIANNMVNVYLRQHKPAAAIALLKPLEKTYGHTKPYKEAIMYKCLLTAYIRAKQYRQAEPYLNEALNDMKHTKPDDPRRFWTQAYVMEYYLGVGQYKKAIALSKDMERLSRIYYKPNDMKVIYYSWYLADSALGNYNDALKHYQRFILIRDSLNSEKVKKETSQMLVQYETEKKERNIQLLTKQSQLQQSMLRQTRLTRNATLAGIGVTLLVIGLLFNRYLLKQRTNKRLELQQTEINEKNARLQHLLTEKEWLLKEIHHRIKNNLQTIMSLLNSQSAYLDNDAALAAIQDSRHRIHAMSLIHQRLYTVDNLSVIDMPVYIQELVGYMRDSFDTGQRIRFDIAIAPLWLDVSQAIPLALILNEAITNALKYAFPYGQTGTVGITLRHETGRQYVLMISDDGIGIPETMKHRTGSLGMSLMKGLSEDLDGSFEIAANNGTIVTISFVQDIKQL